MAAIIVALLVGLIVSVIGYSLLMRRMASRAAIHSRLQGLQNVDQSIDIDIAQETLEENKRKPYDLRDIPFVNRTVIPLVKAIANAAYQLAPKQLASAAERRIILAGKQGKWSVQMVALAVVVFAVGGFFGISTYLADQNFPVVQKMAIMVLGTLACGALPFVHLNSLVQKRKASIQKQLPEVLDLMCVSVQAGLSFDGSLNRIVARMQGHLIDEFARMLRDVRMGVTRRDALRELASRCDLPEVQLFVTAIIQSEQLGTSMSSTMAAQAENMREYRRQRAKALALKAPIKILFPLILFIFPAIFVVVLIPKLLVLTESFK